MPWGELGGVLVCAGEGHAQPPDPNSSRLPWKTLCACDMCASTFVFHELTLFDTRGGGVVPLHLHACLSASIALLAASATDQQRLPR